MPMAICSTAFCLMVRRSILCLLCLRCAAFGLLARLVLNQVVIKPDLQQL
jgi:hypothetical protein